MAAPVMEPNAAGVDIGATEIYIAVILGGPQTRQIAGSLAKGACMFLNERTRQTFPRLEVEQCQMGRTTPPPLNPR